MVNIRQIFWRTIVAKTKPIHINIKQIILGVEYIRKQ